MFKKILIVSLILLPVLGYSEDLTLKLKEIQAKIASEESKLSKLRKSESELEKEVNQAEKKLRVSKAERKGVLSSVTTIDKNLLHVQDELSLKKTLLEIIRERFKERVVAIYKMYRRASGVDYLVNSESLMGLIKRGQLLSYIAKQDRALLTNLIQTRKDFEKKSKDLKILKFKKSTELKKRESLELDLERTLNQRSFKLLEKNEESKKIALSLSKLKQSAREIEQIISGVTNRSSDVSGVSFGRKKGGLSFPVQGRIVQYFGKKKHSEFSDLVFVKGLEFASDVGEKVRSVEAGKVIFNQVLPGFGSVLIVDHGKRYYSLYGRLSTILKRVGDVVGAREVIAVLGEQDSKGKNFYFELRHKGKAIDPTPFFSAGNFATEGGVVKIGVLLPFSSKHSGLAAEVKKGLDLAVKNSNTTTKVFLYYRDTKGSSNTAYAEYLNLVNKEKVDFILGPILDPAIRKLHSSKAKRAPLLSFSDTYSFFRDKNYIFPYGFVVELVELVAYLKSSHGAKKLAIVYPESESQFIESSLKDLNSRFGLEIAKYSYPVSEESLDTKLVAKLEAYEPRAIIFADQLTNCVHIVRQLKDSKIKDVIISGTSLWDKELLFETYADLLDDSVVATELHLASNRSEVIRYLSQYEKSYGSSSPSAIAGLAYDLGSFIIRSLKMNNWSVLESAKDMASKRDITGVLGKYLFTHRGDIERRVSIIKVKDGKPLEVFGINDKRQQEIAR